MQSQVSWREGYLRPVSGASIFLEDGLEKGSGGDFYLTQAARVSKRFARALVVGTLEGRTLYADAFRLLGFSKMATFHELGHSLGVA